MEQDELIKELDFHSLSIQIQPRTMSRFKIKLIAEYVATVMSLLTSNDFHFNHRIISAVYPLSVRPSKGLVRKWEIARGKEKISDLGGNRTKTSEFDRLVFSLPRAISHFLTWANVQWEIHGCTLALQS